MIVLFGARHSYFISSFFPLSSSTFSHAFPQVATVGNLVRSINIYLLPCFHVLASRFVHAIWGKLFCCFDWPYEDNSFFGASALGDHEVSVHTLL